MSKIQAYSVKGNKLEAVDFPKERTVEPNMNLISQAMYVFENRSHKGTSKTKTRAEVQATTAKMYKQKGTGNARHGARTAPLFAGGGTAHGPHGIKRTLKISNSLKSRALNMALSMKVKEGKAILVDKMESLTKTKEAQSLLNSIMSEADTKLKSGILIAVADGKKEINRVFRNIRGVTIDSWKNLNVHKVYLSNLLIIDKDALKEAKSGPSTTLRASKSTKKDLLKSETEAPKKVKNVRAIKRSAKSLNKRDQTKAQKTIKKVKKGSKK